MRIGIDIDGVLNNCAEFQRDCGIKHCYDIGKYEFNGIAKYKLYDTFGWDKSTDIGFWDIYYRVLINDMPIRRYGKEIIDKLKQEGNEIYIITARAYYKYDSPKYTLEEIRNDTIKWLEEKEVYYDKLIFAEDPKLEDCLKNNIDLMIEDSSYNIQVLSQKVQTICYDAEYNKNLEGKNIIRCYSWYDIYKIVKEMKS